MAGLCKNGNEPPGSLKDSKFENNQFVLNFNLVFFFAEKESLQDHRCGRGITSLPLMQRSRVHSSLKLKFYQVFPQE